MDNNTSSPFNNLLSEVCEVILMKLAQNDALNLRLVSKRWKVLVDELYPNWSIKIDEECPDLERILELKIKTVKVDQLAEPLTFLPLQSNSSILRYPDVLENLSMEFMRSNIGSEDLHRFLFHTKNLTNLTLNLNKLNLVDTFDKEPTSYNLANVLNLKIYIQSIPLICSQNNFFDQLMNHSDLSKLKSFEIDIFSYRGDYPVLWKSFFLFLKRAKLRCKNLVSLDVGVDVYEIVLPVFVDVGDCYSNFEKFEIRTWWSGEVFEENWKNVIQSQNALKDFKICYPSISSVSIANVVSKNFETLKLIEIIDHLKADRMMIVDGVNTPYFNLDIFQNCRNLKKLLIRLVFEGGVFVNFNRLPPNVQKLSLHKGFLDSNEISVFLSGQVELNDLEISGAGTLGRYGVNGTVLDLLLRLETLKWISVGYSSINCSVREEREQLQRIYASTSNSTITELVDGNEVIRFDDFMCRL